VDALNLTLEDSPQTQSPERVSETQVRALLEQVVSRFAENPFIPHPIFTQGDLQTIVAHFWPSRFFPDHVNDETRLFQIDNDTRVLAYCRWQAERAKHPTLILWHGMEGSTASGYMLSTADKAFAAGFNVVRVNYRNCGGTEQLTPTLYHGGLSDDLRAVLDELITHDHLSRIFIAGFSLGGNLVLKLAGEYAEDPPPELKGICAVSPSIDLRASCDLTNLRRNWIYRRSFLLTLKRRIKVKGRLYPQLYDTTGLRAIRSIEEFDDHYVAPAFGFANASDYYSKASSLPFAGSIRVPTLIIHAEDDPFIPIAPLRDPSIAANPYLLLIATERGGHVAFVSATSRDPDRFWAENRLVEFCNLVSGDGG
jgi:predicted alpha/beta-fold hydrolase